ncbi:MAG: M28 family peptidase [Ferruginibacter sp.]
MRLNIDIMKMVKLSFILFVLCSHAVFAQQTTKEDEKDLTDLKSSINYLASDKLEGRRTGTNGEKLAYEFIEKQFKNNGLKSILPGNIFIQPFDVNDGREVTKTSMASVQGKKLVLNEDYFPLAYSGNAANLVFFKWKDAALKYYDLKNVLEENVNNPHFDLHENILIAAKDAEMAGKKVFIITNTSQTKDELAFDAKDRTAPLNIPVVYFTKNIKFKDIAVRKNADLVLNFKIAEKKRIGHNVVGFINNNAANTIVIGAHYDHLGYGEDHNSLYTGKIPQIHNGADDNASGTAALIELGNWLPKSGLTKYNYLLVAFSGEELGLFGSKYFIEHSPITPTNINYMINMDMVGRLNDSTHGLTIGGYGTSPFWGEIIKTNDPYFKIKVDSSGSGPSDHTSFYRKDIPVLFFFTGTHSDYHKPSDDADKINYGGEVFVINYIKNILARTNKEEKLSFTKTREAAVGTSSFKVSLGIMPDYTFSGAGVLVDGVSDNRPAQKAGIKVGDVLYQLGDFTFTDVETYMGALNKFNKGDATTVKVKRGKEELEFHIVF